jgi:hypothetical protein
MGFLHSSNQYALSLRPETPRRGHVPEGLDRSGSKASLPSPSEDGFPLDGSPEIAERGRPLSAARNKWGHLPKVHVPGPKRCLHPSNVSEEGWPKRRKGVPAERAAGRRNPHRRRGRRACLSHRRGPAIACPRPASCAAAENGGPRGRKNSRGARPPSERIEAGARPLCRAPPRMGYYRL